MSTRLDWDVVRGDTKTLAFAVTFDDGSTDITGASVRVTARCNGAPVILKRNLAAGGSDAELAITDALAGELSVYLVTTDLPLHLLPSGAQVILDYDLEITRADGVRETCAHGRLIVMMDQTR